MIRPPQGWSYTAHSITSTLVLRTLFSMLLGAWTLPNTLLKSAESTVEVPDANSVEVMDIDNII